MPNSAICLSFDFDAMLAQLVEHCLQHGDVKFERMDDVARRL